MTLKVRYTEEKGREGRTRRIRKEVVGCFQAMVEKKKFEFNLNMGRG